MMQDRVDRFLVAVHDVEHAVGQAGLLQQLGHADARRRILLRRLQDERVPAGERHREHPHRHHRREIERRDARADAERLQPRVRVDAAADRLGVLALQQVRRADGELDDLDAALHRAHRVEKHLAVLLADERRELLLVLLDAARETGSGSRARRSGGVARHAGNAAAAAFDRVVDVGGIRERHGPDHLRRSPDWSPRRVGCCATWSCCPLIHRGTRATACDFGAEMAAELDMAPLAIPRSLQYDIRP